MKRLGVAAAVLAALVVSCGPNTAGPAVETPGQEAAPDPAANARLRAECQNQLKQLGLVFKMFASESAGEVWPELSPQAGKFTFGDENKLYPGYMADLSVLICPAERENSSLLIDGHSYIYLGYVVMNENDLNAFARAYKERIAKGLSFDEDLVAGDGTVLRLREGVERLIAADPNDPAGAAKIQSEIPVLVERPGNHEPEGGNVLFMDGHTEYLRYSDMGKWPMTKAFFETVESLEAFKAP